MTSLSDRKSGRRASRLNRLLISAIVAGSLVQPVVSNSSPAVARNWQAEFFPKEKRTTHPVKKGPPPQHWDGQVPLVVSNNCDDTIWPGITTQSGTGPGIGGFQLEAGDSKKLWVASNWQGRVWGRTNCTVSGDSASCKTGDCMGKMDCQFSGDTPATLAEFNLEGGVDGNQTFYDISLVDGYNIPIGIKYIPGKNTTFIPPNLTNSACIATTGWLHAMAETGTYYTNSTYPVPLEADETNNSIRRWCPWPDLAFPPTKPGDGVYPYPDDNIQRPAFSPCNSACAATGEDKDCCEGKYHSPSACKPSLYSKNVKAICPDAYSYAYDDQSSTFIVPSGGGWEVVMCPAGRSTNILQQLGTELFELASNGALSAVSLGHLKDIAYIEADRGGASGLRPTPTGLIAVAVVVGAWFAM